MVHQERDGAAMGTAPKTVIELFVGAYGKRRGLFLMKRAQPQKVNAAFSKLHVPADDVNNVDPGK